MKMIVGLGNPGSQYENTRHNMGFGVIDVLAARAGIRVIVNRDRGLCGQGMLAGEKVLLVKPLTYMNLSGECIAPLSRYYHIPPEDILVICDDINLDLGRLRIRLKGSAGGHNGLKNIIALLGSDAFPRIRCGCGFKPEPMGLADFVLSHFSFEEKKTVLKEWNDAADAAECFLKEGAAAAMNRFNGRKDAAPAKPKKEKKDPAADGTKKDLPAKAAESKAPAQAEESNIPAQAEEPKAPARQTEQNEALPPEKQPEN